MKISEKHDDAEHKSEEGRGSGCFVGMLYSKCVFILCLQSVIKIDPGPCAFVVIFAVKCIRILVTFFQWAGLRSNRQQRAGNMSKISTGL